MPIINGLSTNIEKIDSLAVNGLSGVSNSLAYKVHMIERHIHSGGRWLGLAGTPTATHFADRIGITSNPFQIDFFIGLHEYEG